MISFIQREKPLTYTAGHTLWPLKEEPTELAMHRSANFKTPPNAVDLPWSCEGLWRGLSFVCSISYCHLTI